MKKPSASILRALCACVTFAVIVALAWWRPHAPVAWAPQGKLLVAVAALGLWIARFNPYRPIHSRAFHTCASALIGVAAIVAHLNFSGPRPVHGHEFFHYYIGSKYAAELGYKRLYHCAAVATNEDDIFWFARDRYVRNLQTNLVGHAKDFIHDVAPCREHFFATRWADFKSDVGWFRQNMEDDKFAAMLVDHGYNPPPVWTFFGHALSARVEPSFTAFRLLALIDVAFVIALFAAVHWSFGATALTCALVVWGCQIPADYLWTGGAFLRQDWLLALVLSACFCRRRKFRLAGAALALSSLLRIFPVLFASGWLVQAFVAFRRRRVIPAAHKRLLFGFALTSVVLVGASLSNGGMRNYVEFFDHIRHHGDTPLLNHVGLPTIVAYKSEHPASRLGERLSHRPATLRERGPVFAALLLGLLALLVACAKRVRSPWVALVLSSVVPIAALRLSGYYYSFVLLWGLVAALRGWLGAIPIAGVVCGAALVFFPGAWLWEDSRHVSLSLVMLCTAIALLIAMLPRRPSPRAVRTRDGPRESDPPLVP